MTEDSDIHNDDTIRVPAGDQPAGVPLLQVYRVGKLTVVGFGGQDVPDELNLAFYREQLIELIREHKCEELAFDLTGVLLIPSGLLGLMASIRDQGVKVAVYNASKDIREVLAITNLDELIEIREVDTEPE